MLTYTDARMNASTAGMDVAMNNSYNSDKEKLMKSWNEKIKDLEGWHFGGKGSGLEDSLSELVVKGIKTATSSWYETYSVENEPIPKVGEQSYILSSKDRPVCVIEVTDVEIRPFLEVTADFAYLEGEGNRTLEYWRQAHESFFTNYGKEINLIWDPQTQNLVCETFKVIHIF